MAARFHFSIKRLLQLSLAIVLLFLIAISLLYYFFIYHFSKSQFESSLESFSQSIEAQLDTQYAGNLVQ